MRPTRESLQRLCCIFAIGVTMMVVAIDVVSAQDTGASDEPLLSEDEIAARRRNDTFLTLLKRNPRAGTALDRIFSFHAERGTLDAFLDEFAEDAKSDANDETAAMLLGLFELKRGDDAAAVAAFRQAEVVRPGDSVAAWYLARALTRIGEQEEAAQAYERAIARSPQKADLLEIYQELGRLYQRTQQTEKALDVWRRLEQQFPDDLRVREQIASIQADEGEYESALRRYEKLARDSTDPYRRVENSLTAADLLIKLGRAEEGLKRYEQQLPELKPDSWLFRDVRRRIEETFVRSDDYSGLADYYEKWLRTHPNDLDAMSRIAFTFAVQNRSVEARSWYQRALERAPSDIRLHEALIEQFIRDKEYTAAIAQYQELERHAPGDADHIEQLGFLILNHAELPTEERRKEAADVWLRLLTLNPDDPVTISHVADLLRNAELSDQAVSLYEKAIALAPADSQYREYLGEFYHSIERPDDALRTWRSIADGANRTAPNLARLSVILGNFGYDNESLAAMAEACELDPEFPDLLRFSRLLRDAGQITASLEQLERAQQLAELPAERQSVIDARIESLIAGGLLEDATTQLEKELAVDQNPTTEQWKLLATYYIAAQREHEAIAAIESGLKLEPDSIECLSIAADLYETSDLLAESAEILRRLVTLDRRSRSDHLRKIAALEKQLGRHEAALQAARDLITTAPGNPQSYRFYADLCFEFGRMDEGLQTLRKAVRVSPTDEDALLTLAGALASNYRTAEAIELYWRAFEKAADLDSQVGMINNLTDLYLRNNRFDQLIQRLKAREKQAGQKREMAICLANAFLAAGDPGMAKQTLQGLLTDGSRDVYVLRELLQLCEQEHDYEAAAEYQQRINRIAASDEGRSRLAQLLVSAGNIEQAEAIWLENARRETEPRQVMGAIDGLLQSNRLTPARTLCEELLRKQPENWELLYRLGLINWKEGNDAAATESFRSLLALDLPFQTPSAAEAFRIANDPMADRNDSVTRSSARLPLSFRVVGNAQAINTQLGLSGAPSTGSPIVTFVPAEFADARMVSVLFLQLFGVSEPNDDVELQLSERATAIPRNEVAVWDWFFYSALSPDQGIVDIPDELLHLLSELDSREAHTAVLHVLRARDMFETNEVAEWQQVLAGAYALNVQRPEPKTIALALEQYARIAEGPRSEPRWEYTFAPWLISALERAGQNDEAERFYQSLVSSNDPEAIPVAIRIASRRGDVDETLRLLERRSASPDIVSSVAVNLTEPPQSDMSVLQSLAMSAIVRNRQDDLLRVLDAFAELRLESIADPLQTAVAQAANPVSSFQPMNSSPWGVYLNGGRQTLVTASGQSGFLPLTALPLQSFSVSGRYLDAESLLFLGTINGALADRGKSQALTEWARESRRVSDGDAAVLAELILSQLCQWDGDSVGSTIHLIRAAELAPEDNDMRLKLVQTLSQSGHVAEALQLLDSMTSTDPALLRDREQLALNLAITSNNKVRAEAAAKTLFGLRLDTNSQMLLATQMRQLGMTDLAKTVLARVRQRSAGDSQTLFSLMQQYQQVGDSNTANVIAHQIVRRVNRGVSVRGGNDDTLRRAALQVLRASGDLDELIARTEAQITQSPGSIRLHENLVAYLEAAGQAAKLQAASAALAKLQPSTPRRVSRIGVSSGQALDQVRAACDNYLKTLKDKPLRLRHQATEMVRAFQRVRRLPELADALLQSDASSLRFSVSDLATLISAFVADGSSQEQGYAFLRAMLKAGTVSRRALLQQLPVRNFAADSRLTEILRECVVPRNPVELGTGWEGIADSVIVPSSGAPATTLTYLMDGITPESPAQDLADAIQKGLQQFPAWHAGKLILAVREAKTNNPNEARRLLRGLLDDDSVSIPHRIAWAVASELQATGDAMLPETIALMEIGTSGSMSWLGSQSTTARQRLILARLYFRDARKSEARETLLKSLELSLPNRGGVQARQSFQQVADIQNAAQELMRFGMPLDALQLYTRLTPGLLTNARQFGGQHRPSDAEIRNQILVANRAVTPAILLEYLKRQDGTISPGSIRRPIDLLLSVQPFEENSRSVNSVVLDTLASVSRNSPAEAEEFDEYFTQRISQSPESLNSLISAEVFAVTNGRDVLQMKTESLLENWLSMNPSSDTSDLTSADVANRPNAEIALWLAARQLLMKDPQYKLGQQLAARAEQAARNHPDPKWLTGLLADRGRLSLRLGDAKDAEMHWSAMLDQVLSRTVDFNSASGTSSGDDSRALYELRQRLLAPAGSQE